MCVCVKLTLIRQWVLTYWEKEKKSSAAVDLKHGNSGRVSAQFLPALSFALLSFLHLGLMCVWSGCMRCDHDQVNNSCGLVSCPSVIHYIEYFQLVLFLPAESWFPCPKTTETWRDSSSRWLWWQPSAAASGMAKQRRLVRGHTFKVLLRINRVFKRKTLVQDMSLESRLLHTYMPSISLETCANDVSGSAQFDVHISASS